MPPILRSVSSLRGSAAHTQYSLWIQGFEDEALSVLGFTAEDYALSAEYRFEIEFEAREALDPAKCIGRRARLELDAVHPGAAPVHGVVTRIEALEGASDGVRQRLSLCAPLTVLDQAAATRAFPDLAVPEIIEEVLEGHGLGADAWRLALEQNYPALELTVQCAETDLAFLKRLMARHGLYYRYEQGDDQAVLVIHDSVKDLPEAPVGSLPYIPLKGENRSHEAVHRIERMASLLTESVRLGDYNPETPDAALTGEAANATDIPGTGEKRAWGEHLRDSEGAGTCARLAAERLAWQRARVRAFTDHRRLAPGMRLSLEGHPDARVNITYTVVALRISADQRAALPMGGEAERPTFEAELTLIPAALCYRPEPIAPPRLGRVTARIESAGGDYAHLDEHGRYRLRLDFDERDNDLPRRAPRCASPPPLPATATAFISPCSPAPRCSSPSKTTTPTAR
jgi:type VI secretion system secreted protein VgrG